MATYKSELAGRTALYRAYDAADELLYVGITRNPLGRIAKHRHQKTWWITNVARIEVEWFAFRSDAIVAEKYAIREENPVHNIARPGVNA